MRRLPRWGRLAALAALFTLLVVDGAQAQRRNQPQSPPPQAQPAPAAKSAAELAEEAKAREDREARAREDRAELDRKLVKFNSDLTSYAFALAIVAGLQLLVLTALAIMAAVTLKALRTAATAAREAAEDRATAALGRPYVLPTDVGKIYVSNDPQVRHFVQFRIGNYGKVPAVLRRVQGRFIVAETPLTAGKVDGSSAPDGTDDVHEWQRSVTLAPDQRIGLSPFFLPKHVQIDEHQGAGRPAIPPHHELLLRLAVSFWDVARCERTNVSLWKYDQARSGFVSWGDSQFNYETEDRYAEAPAPALEPRSSHAATIRSVAARAMRSAQVMIQRLFSAAASGLQSLQATVRRWRRSTDAAKP